MKVGTSTLTTEDGHLDIEKIKKIVLELSNLQDKGYDVILVTSGAVGAGMGLLNISEKPKTLAEKQMLSAVGQVSLMQIYQTLFKEHNKIIGQLLLTKEEFIKAFPRPKEINTPIKPIEVATAINKLRHFLSKKLLKESLNLFLKDNPLFFDFFNDFTILHFDNHICVFSNLWVMSNNQYCFPSLGQTFEHFQNHLLRLRIE